MKFLSKKKKIKPPAPKAKISAKLKIMEDLWSRMYTMASKCTLDTKTRNFQFKILNNVLYLNKQLYKMNLSVSPLCSLCFKLLHIYSLNAVTRLTFGESYKGH